MATRYCKRVWLNRQECPSTGSVVCHDGTYNYGDEKTTPDTFIEIADCRNKIRLHQSVLDTKEDFVCKLKILKDQIEMFIAHLENSN